MTDITDDKVTALIHTHIERYAEFDLLDVYKLLHQAVFGPGHAIPNQKAAREWLERESSLLTIDAVQPLVEVVHPANEIVRLHLRPYLAAKGNLGKLLDAFVQSAKLVSGSTDTMAQWWAIFNSMTEKYPDIQKHFDPRTVALIGRTRAAEQWPASHHSPRFDRAYKPAYRVLTWSIADSLLQDQRIPFSMS